MDTVLTLIPLVLYVALLVFIGVKSYRNKPDEEEFLLSGRTLSLPAFVATLVSTWYGGILGVGEFTYSYGISVWFVFGLPYYFFALLFALFIAPRVRRAKNFSIPDMLYRSYNKPTGMLGSLFLVVMTSPAPYILMLALLIQFFLGFGFIWSVLIGAFFSVFYVYKGGFRSVVQTDKLQFTLMFGGFVVLLIFLIRHSFPVSELFHRLDSTHQSVTGGLDWQSLLVWFLIASWTFIDPGFHQRSAAAKSPGVARNGILISLIFWLVFDSLTMLTGLYAYILLPDIQPMMSYPLLAEQVLPPLLKGIFFTGLLATIMSTIDSYTFLSALTFGRDIWKQIRRQGDSHRAVQIGLLLTALIAIGLIYFLPSVIQLWYHLGSLFIPPLLLPLIAAYFPVLRLSGRSTFLVMLASFILSFTAFLWGQLHQLDGQAQYLFHLEPFFPGMGLSIGWYVLGNLRKRLPGSSS